MYLAYLDDSEQRGWQVIGAVLLPANSFFVAELLSAIEIENLMPPERRHEFTEFHASELYCGEGIFKGIDQNVRFNAITNLLNTVATCEAKVAYGSVDLARLRSSSYHSANSRDVAFRRCVMGVEEWIYKTVLGAMTTTGDSGSEYTTLFIMDEPAESDKKTLAVLQKSFRSLRSRFRVSGEEGNRGGRLSFVHDDMYFGDSRYSIGIQIADLCSYFIAKHLYGDVDSEGFYKMIEPHIISTGKED